MDDKKVVKKRKARTVVPTDKKILQELKEIKEILDNMWRGRKPL